MRVALTGVSAGKYIKTNMSSTTESEKPATNKITNITEFFANLLETVKKDPSDLIKFFIGLFTLCITFAVFYFAANNQKALTDQFYLYVFFGIIPVVIGIAIVANIFSSSPIKDPLTAYNRFTFYAAILLIFIVV